ncbi:MAG: D-tyrosyl-tRNA(Tyr) deacylase [Bacteroidetes bacterium]|nr:D-tyrosyl-tRNA(Tyr) deacylase [Bacteroidota bacterium]
MRVLIQKVTEASVSVEGKIISHIGEGLLILLGIETEDDQSDAEWLSGKISNLRIFDDENGVMNRSVCDVKGEFLVVSQFTLHASTKKGNRPSYIKSARPEHAIPLYEYFKTKLAEVSALPVKSGEFGADMQIQLINNGPVTIWIDSKNRE